MPHQLYREMKIYDKSYVPPKSIFVEHYESQASFNEMFELIKINEDGLAEWSPTPKKEIIKLLNCEALEFDSSTFEDDRLVSDIEQLRLLINPRIDFPPNENIEVIQRSFEIERNQKSLSGN
jgi:hypothetical protein